METQFVAFKADGTMTGEAVFRHYQYVKKRIEEYEAQHDMYTQWRASLPNVPLTAAEEAFVAADCGFDLKTAKAHRFEMQMLLNPIFSSEFFDQAGMQEQMEQDDDIDEPEAKRFMQSTDGERRAMFDVTNVLQPQQSSGSEAEHEVQEEAQANKGTKRKHSE